MPRCSNLPAMQLKVVLRACISHPSASPLYYRSPEDISQCVHRIHLDQNTGIPRSQTPNTELSTHSGDFPPRLGRFPHLPFRTVFCLGSWTSIIPRAGQHCRVCCQYRNVFHPSETDFITSSALENRLRIADCDCGSRITDCASRIELQAQIPKMPPAPVQPTNPSCDRCRNRKVSNGTVRGPVSEMSPGETCCGRLVVITRREPSSVDHIMATLRTSHLRTLCSPYPSPSLSPHDYGPPPYTTDTQVKCTPLSDDELRTAREKGAGDRCKGCYRADKPCTREYIHKKPGRPLG